MIASFKTTAIFDSHKLRAALEEITGDGTCVETHPAKLEAIALEIRHNICVLPPPLDEPLENFNCVMHAFGLIKQIEPPCHPVSGRFYVDIIFFASLIDQAILQPCTQAQGTLVVWSSAGAVKHAGVVVAPGRASSKWGLGHLYEHDLHEVPTSYGDELTFYSAISTDDAKNYLSDYWTHGRIA